ncbi:hypothetical protein [Pantoea ananatis]|uniref:hypothetical protein n=1 Tax=Pantoea ananas TaxID=553 RepID=UPI00351CCF20
MLNFKSDFSEFITGFYLKQFTHLNTQEREHVLETLGVTPSAINEFITSEDIYITLPHASMNVFFPRAGVSRYVYDLQNSNKNAFHLRFFLTHTNFSDLNWRPYAWWFNNGGKIDKLTFFTRNKKKKHNIVYSLKPNEMHSASVDRRLRHDFDTSMKFKRISLSFIYMTAVQEVNSGFAHKGRTLYLPLDAFVAFIINQAKNDVISFNFLEAFLSQAQCRRLNGEELTFTSEWRDAFIFDNFTNIALLNFFQPAAFVGGEKMDNYWHQVIEKWKMALPNQSEVEFALPTNLVMPAVQEYIYPYKPSSDIAEQLIKNNIPYSLTMAIQEHDLFSKKE